MEILDAYTTQGPDPQTVLDIFKGEWSSKMPVGSGLTSAPGPAGLFEDGRIDWLSQTIGGFDGKKILELGPLEAAHTYMMHQAGAGSIVGIEANSRAYLKCLCIQQIFGLDRAKFLYADAMKYTVETEEKFDLCVASGILYHMSDPVQFINNVALRSNQIYLWTHYYDEILRDRPDYDQQFDELQEIEFGGKKYSGSKRKYNEALNWTGFLGGSKPWALWLTRDSLYRLLEDNGFEITGINFDHASHQNGPSLAIVAVKS